MHRTLIRSAAGLLFPCFLGCQESFYANKWTELEETAKVLGQTAGMVTKATGVPAAREKEITVASGQLAQKAGSLRSLAAARDEKGVNACMQEINALVRTLRLEP